MHNKLRKLGLALVMTVALAGSTVALPDTASARWGGGGHWGGGHWGGGHWHGGGWGRGGVGVGLGAGLLIAAATTPYYGAITAIPITMTTDLMGTAMVILTDIVATQAIIHTVATTIVIGMVATTPTVAATIADVGDRWCVLRGGLSF